MEKDFLIIKISREAFKGLIRDAISERAERKGAPYEKERLLTFSEATRYLDTIVGNLSGLVDNNLLKVYTFGGKLAFRKADLDAFKTLEKEVSLD